MTVSDLIKRLQKCDPDASVFFAFASDNTTTGDAVVEVLQISYFDEEQDNPLNDVLLRA